MIAVYSGKRTIGEDDFYDLFFFDDVELTEQRGLSLGGVIFTQPYTLANMEERAIACALSEYPDDTINEVIIR